MFTLDATTVAAQPWSIGSGTTIIKLVSTTPAALPFGVTQPPAFHPQIAAIGAPGSGVRAPFDAAAAHTGGAGTPFKLTTQVLFSPAFTPTGPICAPVAAVDINLNA